MPWECPSTKFRKIMEVRLLLSLASPKFCCNKLKQCLLLFSKFEWKQNNMAYAVIYVNDSFVVELEFLGIDVRSFFSKEASFFLKVPCPKRLGLRSSPFPATRSSFIRPWYTDQVLSNFFLLLKFAFHHFVLWWMECF